MAQEINFEGAKQVLDSGIDKAQEVLSDPAKLDELLADLKVKAASLPSQAGSALAKIPLMVDMVKGYVTQSYTEVSPKVIATLVAAFLYLVKGKDIIPDSLPIVGLVDDIAVVALAMKLNEPELDAFEAWKKAQEQF